MRQDLAVPICPRVTLPGRARDVGDQRDDAFALKYLDIDERVVFRWRAPPAASAT
jgi:hypothetical protein